MTMIMQLFDHEASPPDWNQVQYWHTELPGALC